MKRLLPIAGIAALIGTALFFLPLDGNHPAKEESNLIGKIMGRYHQEWLMTHDPATGTIPRERLLRAYKVAQQRRQALGVRSGIIPILWEERGPNNIGGRTRGLIYDANDPTGRTVWAAGVSGGLWRCDDISANPPTWANIDDFFSNLAITTIAQDPNNPNNMYFGTGENGFGNGDAVRGMGIWQSTDGGLTWEQMPAIFISSNPAINKVVVDNASTLFAATNGGLFSFDALTESWDFEMGSGNNVQDIEIAADGTMYATVNGDGIYRFVAPGPWNELTGAPLPASGFGRIETVTAPSNPDVVYAAYESGGFCLNIFRSADGGDNWNTATCPANLGGGNGQLWYDLIMAVDPNDPTRVWVGGVPLYVSGDSGNNWVQATNIHVDHHALVYRPGNSDEMLFGNDGGVYRSTDASAADPTLVNRNNTYNVTQFYANALHPTAGTDYILGGTQDNGTQRFQCGGVCTTDLATGKDGGFCFIDQDDPTIQITSSQLREFWVSNNGGGSFPMAIPPNNNALFITPAGYDSDSDILYFSDGQDTLGRLSGVGPINTMTIEIISQMNNGRISAVAISPNINNRIFLGITNGRILQVDNADMAGSITVTQFNSPFSSFISSIAIEDGNELHLLATASNYGVNSIFESTDGGTSWTSVEGDLPDMPVRWCMFSPADASQALIATELGVWTTDELDGNDTEWFPTNTFGLANVRTDMLQYRSSDHLVAAATHGRGVYTTDYFSLLETCDPSLMIGGSIPAGLYMAEDFITSDGTIPAERRVIFHAGNSITLEEDFHAEAGSFFIAAIQPCGMEVDPSPLEEALAENLVSRTTSQWQEPRMQCFPNPAAYTLTVSVELPAGRWYQLYIKNLQGQLVGTVSSGTQSDSYAQQFEVHAEQLEAGMYVLVLQTKEGAVSEKFVVVR